VKRQILAGLAGIAVLGGGAVLLIIRATEPGAAEAPAAEFDRAQARAQAQGGQPAPHPPQVEPQPPPTPPPAPQRLQLPDGIAARDVTAPIAGCLKDHPTSTGGGARLTLELEALEEGGLRIVGVPVAAWGNASQALVECAQRRLAGRTIAIGRYAPGERYLAAYDLESAAVEPPPPPAPPSTLPPRRGPQRGAGGTGSRR